MNEYEFKQLWNRLGKEKSDTCAVPSDTRFGGNSRFRNTHQRRMYASRRASLAVDRMIRARSSAEEIAAGRWALAWGSLARFSASRRA